MNSQDRRAEGRVDCKNGGLDRQALLKVDRLCGSQRVTEAIYRHVSQHAWAFDTRPLRVLDIASRDVSIPLRWAHRLTRRGRPIELTLARTGGDKSAGAAIAEARDAGLTVDMFPLESLTSPTPGGFDLVTSLHVLHRLNPHQAFRHLQTLQVSTTGPLVVCDYERSRLNRLLAIAASRISSRDKQVHQLADECIGNAFSLSEFQELAVDALARPVQVEHLFPCHFIGACSEQMVTEPVPAFA